MEFNITIANRPEFEMVNDFWLRLCRGHNGQSGTPDAKDRTDFRIVLNYSYNF